MTRSKTIGTLAFVAAIAGAGMGLYLTFMTPEVSDDRWSYPQTATHFAWMQVGFMLQHIPLILGLLAATVAVGPSRVGRTGWFVGIAGMVALTVNEGLAILPRHQASDSALAGTIGALYGVGTLLIAVGLMIGGMGAVKAGIWRKAESWLLFLLGGWLLVPALPVLIFWSLEPSRIVLSMWMLLFAGLGWALVRRSSRVTDA